MSEAFESDWVIADDPDWRMPNGGAWPAEEWGHPKWVSRNTTG